LRTRAISRPAGEQPLCVRLRNCRSEVIEPSGRAQLTGSLSRHRQRHDLPLLRLFSPSSAAPGSGSSPLNLGLRAIGVKAVIIPPALAQAAMVDLIAAGRSGFEAVLFPVRLFLTAAAPGFHSKTYRTIAPFYGAGIPAFGSDHRSELAARGDATLARDLNGSLMQ
jgi:hypothetical protein